MDYRRDRKIAWAEHRYRLPQHKGRPRRVLVRVNRQYGLVCIQCHRAKPLTNFGFSHAQKGYFESMCIACKAEYHRNRRKK